MGETMTMLYFAAKVDNNFVLSSVHFDAKTGALLGTVN